MAEFLELVVAVFLALVIPIMLIIAVGWMLIGCGKLIDLIDEGRRARRKGLDKERGRTPGLGHAGQTHGNSPRL